MPTADIPANVALLAGPQLFGHLFNYGLFGILTDQVYFYHLTFPRDPTRLKVLIYVLYALECLQITLASHDAYKVLGEGWGDPEALFNPHLLWFETPVMTGIISAIVQCYFAWRIYVLSVSRVLSGLICLLAFMQGCAAIAGGFLGRVLTPDWREKAVPAIVVWLVGSAICDILIAACMLYFLSRGRQGLASDALLSRLIRLTVETGSLTASLATLDLILFVTFKDNFLHFIPALMLTKVYTNTLMMLINNRARMRSMLMRGDTAGLGGPLQWVIDTSNVDGTSRSAPREQHELVSFKTPVIEAYPDIDSPIDERGKLVRQGPDPQRQRKGRIPQRER
ncbi:hypothetical protein C8Q76DRAFT_799500 [Earliella scabrosa]|nr:hypothetical protein C8Q76DRAFT_799500 [Earliella scabrosa]